MVHAFVALLRTYTVDALAWIGKKMEALSSHKAHATTVVRKQKSASTAPKNMVFHTTFMARLAEAERLAKQNLAELKKLARMARETAISTQRIGTADATVAESSHALARDEPITEAKWRLRVCASPDLWDAKHVASEIHLSSPAVAPKWADEHRLIAVLPPGRKYGWRFPAWQFAADVLGESLQNIIRALAATGRDRWEILGFFEAESAALYGLCPREAMMGTTKRKTLSDAARALLASPKEQRIELVLELAGEPPS